ncbi:bestrophin family protein [Corallococcus macrosporus]|uniref:Membrane protein n=1 Tax=Corallococcus macrosporus DSM 14697 TaxID=1189310 RepID=A0A250K4J7_9BACT|nr:bestrophin family ion channel [Corallococcus macrosporus]ATB50830.1 membrane protein [Corallococcus macrosporus DSM 14697]
MIVRPHLSSLRLLFAVRGTILPRVLPHVLGIAALSALVVWAYRQGYLHLQISSPAPLSLLGLTLSIFLGFRINASYDRWWEARKQWGALIVELRAFSHEALALLGDDGGVSLAVRRLVKRNIAFAHALAAHLRGYDAREDLTRLLPEPEAARVLASPNRPNALLREQERELAALLREKQLTDITWSELRTRVQALLHVLGACERIRFTPLPFTYTVLLHRTAYLFCLLLPFGLAEALGWFTPVLAAMVAYTFFGLDRLSDELEEPFGTEPNDLALLAMARTVEMNLLEALGEPQPEPLKPRDFILS